jgi:hypothetical protein
MAIQEMSDKSENDDDSDNSNTDDGDSYSIISETDLETPKMYCSANNWKGQEMIPLMEYLKKHIMRKDFLDEHGLLERLKTTGRISKDTRMVDLDKRGRKMLAEEYKKYVKNLRINFERELIEKSKFRLPFTVNIEQARRSIHYDEEIWICPMFLSPGKHTILFSQDRGDAEPEVALQTTIAPMRKEPPRFHMKAHKHKEVSEKLPPFRKKASVFA